MGSVIKPDAALINAALNKTAQGKIGATAQSVQNQTAQNLPNQSGALSALAQTKVPASAIPVPSTPAQASTPVQVSNPALTGAAVFKAATAALGLPQDALSNALLTFTRFFSVTPDPALLSNLRKEVLASAPNGSFVSSPKTAKERAAMEARALALSAALDKGVSLNQEILDEYSSIPGDSDFSGEQGNQKKREQHHFNEKENIEAEDIKKLFEDFGQNGGEKDFFALLNRIPGKNGQRWIVWPFTINSEGTELEILIRILIKEQSASGVSKKQSPLFQGWLFADIKGPKHNWHFALNRLGKEKLDVNVQVFPGLHKKDFKRFEREMQNTLKDLAAEVEFHFWNDEQPSLVKELVGEILPVINKEV